MDDAVSEHGVKLQIIYDLDKKEPCRINLQGSFFINAMSIPI